MRKNITKKIAIIALVVILLIGTVGVAISRLITSFDDSADHFVLLSEGFTDKKISDEASALTAIRDVADILGIENVNKEFSDCQINVVSSNTYYRFQQAYKGIPIYGRSIIVAADENGNGLSLSGNYINVEDINISPKLSEASALEIAYQNYGKDAIVSSKGLAIYSFEDGIPQLTWMFRVQTDKIMAICFISANNGGIIQEINLFDEYSNQEVLDSVGVDYSINEKGEILLADNSRGITTVKINQEAANSNPEIEKLPQVTCMANDAYNEYTTSLKNLVITYDFFKNYLKRNSFDGNGGDIYLVLCDKDMQIENAIGDGHGEHGYLIIGTPNQLFSKPIGNALDIIGHEYTHMVTHQIVNLIDSAEPNAISEGVSDIIGNLIELQTYGDRDEIWQLGEDAGYNKYSMDDPIDMTSFNHSDTDGHYNAAIISRAAYLMWKGIDGSNIFEPLSTEELANLFYETLYSLPSDCTFSQFRALVQNTAQYQELSNKQRLCVSNAFFQVGIDTAAMPVMKDHLLVDVYGTDGLPYNDYTLYLRNGKNEKIYNGETVNTKGITFSKSGEYQICIVDNANTDNQTTVTVLAVECGGAKTIPIFTECGLSKSDEFFEPAKADILLLRNDPFEDHKNQFELREYEVTGGVQKKEDSYNTYTKLPDMPIIATLTGDFGHNGIMKQLTVKKQEITRKGNEENECIAVNIEWTDGGKYSYTFNLAGNSWNGDSNYCYIVYGTDADYLVIETLTPATSLITKDIYYIGKREWARTERIWIINLDDFSELKYDLEYNTEHDSYTIHEQYSNSAESQYDSQYLYCKDGENYTYGSGFESLYSSFDDAMQHIQKRLSAYGLEDRVGNGNTDHFENDEVTLLFTEHRNGVNQDISLDSISNLELHDKMILGVNPQLSTEIPEDFAQSDLATSIIGAWDSNDGEWRLVFNTTGTDFGVTMDGIKNADGTVDIINLKKGEYTHGSYSLSENSITIAVDLHETKLSVSYADNVLTVGETMFHPIDKTLIDQLIGTWEGNGEKMSFGEKSNMQIYDGSWDRSIFYAVLSESEVLIGIGGGTVRTVPYSVTENCLNFNGTLLYKNGTDSSYSSIQSLKETLCGTWTWKNGNFQDYYVFNEDGTYQYYPTESLYDAAYPTDEGFYEIQDVQTIYLYAERSSAPFVIQYYSEKGLECSIGNYYYKLAE